MKTLTINSLSRKAKIFFTEAHRATNHYYDDNIPYEFHLELVADVVKRFATICGLTYDEVELSIASAYGHDAVSDARITHNDIVKALDNKRLAKICCNLCEDVHGTNRDERNSIEYYNRIKSDKISVFVKLCDRIANVEYGLYNDGTTSSMVNKYKKENPKFILNIMDSETIKTYNVAINYLNELFNY